MAGYKSGGASSSSTPPVTALVAMTNGTLDHWPLTASSVLLVFLEGIQQDDYTFSSNTITLPSVPISGLKLTVQYIP